MVDALEIRSTPRNGCPSVGKISARNAASCPDAGKGRVAINPVDDPSRLKSSNVTDPAALVAFATAMPLCVLPATPDTPADSTYIRNAFPELASAAASVTVTDSGL